MQPQDIDIIATQILFDSKQAIKGLQEFNKAINDPVQKLETLKKIIKEVATQANISFTQAAQAVAKLSGKAGINPQAIRALGKEMQSAAHEAAGLDSSGKQAAHTLEGAFARTFTVINAVRIALGAIVSMVLFQLIQAFTQFSQDAIRQFTELEDTIFRLRNVERELSLNNIEISMSGLKKGIQDIKKLLPIFSQEDISSLVGKVAISTKELGYSEQQILDLAKAIAILNVRSTENETLNQTSSKVITALLSGTTKGVSGLGLQLNDTVIKTKAVEMGFLNAADSLDELSKRDKDLVKLQIIMESTSGELGTINEYLETNSAKLKANAATWNDVKTAAGGLLTTFTPALSSINAALVDAINFWKTFSLIVETFVTWAQNNFLILADIIQDPIGRVKALVDNFKNIPKIFDEIAQKRIPNLFAEMPENAPDWFKKRFGKYLTDVETETSMTTGAPDIDEEKQAENERKAQEHGDKLADIMRENADKLEDIERDFQRKIQDINNDYRNKVSDILRNSAEKREDAARDYSQKIEDINRDAAEKQLEAQQEYRQKEIDREAEFQRRLRELREKFLFDLEDALRERDARQVLRLIRQFQMDKRSLEDKRKLDAQDAKRSLADKLAEIERERQLKIENAKREYDEKLKEIAIGERRAMQEARIWLQRQLAEARLWHQRQLQEQQEYLRRKLEDLRRAYEEELKMAGMYGSQLNKALSLTGTTTTAKVNPTSGAVSTGNISTGIGSGYYNPYDIRARAALGFAEGGTLVARKPTLAVFGEREPEIASFKPINRSGRDANKIFGDIGGVGTPAGGFVRIDMSLSPDLEARVVETSLEQVAVHVERMVRT